MFKKLIIAAFSASFVVSAAFADSTNIGVRISAGELSATGSETTDQATTVTQSNQSSDFSLPSIFVERQIDLTSYMDSEASVSFGLDYVPLTAELKSVTGENGGQGVDADIKAGNYLLHTYNLHFQLMKT